MDIRKIKKLIELLEHSNLTEIEVQEDNERVYLKRASQPTTTPTTIIAPAASALTPPTHTDTPQASTQPALSTEKSTNHHYIKSPMVGTFYISPSPQAKPFVKTGDLVAIGKVVCIVEAMKMFNQIESDIEGKIIECLVENGQAVEFDQPLFKLLKTKD